MPNQEGYVKAEGVRAVRDGGAMNRTEKLRAQLSEALEQIPASFDLLDEFILPGSIPASPDGARGSSSPSRPPLNLVVLDLQDTREKPDSDPQRTDYDIDRRAGARRQGVLPTLVAWVRVVDEERDGEDDYVAPWKREACCQGCPITYAMGGIGYGPCVGALRPHAWIPLTLAEAATFLLDHVDWIVDQQWAVEIADECAAILRDIRAAIGEFDVKNQLACMDCGWDVHEANGGDYFRCSGCAKTWGRIELHRMAERKTPKTMKQCATIIGVSVRTLRYARAEGAFKPVARDGSADLFDLQQVAASVQHLKYRTAAS